MQTNNEKSFIIKLEKQYVIVQPLGGSTCQYSCTRGNPNTVS